MEKVSIIIITLNEEKYLPRLLDSIKKQTYKDFEIIVSDSNSNDKTLEIAKKYSKDFKEFRIKKLKIAKGPAYGRNQGAKLAKYENLLFLDADTILPTNFLEKMLEVKNKKKLDCASFYDSDFDKQLFFRILWSLANFFIFLFQFSKRPIGSGGYLYSKKKIFNQIKGFNENSIFGEDLDYIHKSSRVGKFRIINLRAHFDSRRFKKERLVSYTLRATKYNIIKILKEKVYDKDTKCNYKFGLDYNH